MITLPDQGAPQRARFLATLAHDYPPVVLFGLPIDAAPLPELVSRLLGYLEEADGPVVIATVNPEMIERALEDPSFMTHLQAAHLRVPDGVGVRWAAKRLRKVALPGVPGIELAHALLAGSTARGWEVFLLGGAPGVVDEAATRLQATIPKLNIVGKDHGYHRNSPTDNKAEVRVINTLIAMQPDLLLVAMGIPRQEELIAEVCPHLKGGIVMGVGGSFDVWAGAVERAPRWMSRLGLEWLHRMLRQPARFKRFPILWRFFCRVVRG